MLDIHTHIGTYTEMAAGSHKGREDLLAALDSAGVARAAVLPIPTGPDEPVSDAHNRLVLDQTVQHERLIPFCCVDAGREPGAQVRRAFDNGARGVKIHPVLQRCAIDDPAFEDAYGAAEELGIPVLIHTGQFIGHKIAGKARPGPLELARTLAVDNVAERFPDLKIILAHFGWPWADEAIAIMSRRENVWVDLAGFAPKHFPPQVWSHITKVAPHKFLFATDFPFLRPDRWISEFFAHVEDERVRDLVTTANANRVLGLD